MIQLVELSGWANFDANKFDPLHHRVVVAVLNTKISRVRKTLIFGTVWIVGINPNAWFYLIQWPFIIIFPKKLRAAELDNTEHMRQFFKQIST